jgi:hypothetical protein
MPLEPNWATIIQSDQLDDLTEREILPDFLTLFFGELLGAIRL